jgi:hypothetical protein
VSNEEDFFSNSMKRFLKEQVNSHDKVLCRFIVLSDVVCLPSSVIVIEVFTAMKTQAAVF